MTRRPRHAAERAMEREVGVVAAVLVTGSEKAAAHRFGLSYSTVIRTCDNGHPPARVRQGDPVVSRSR